MHFFLYFIPISIKHNKKMKKLLSLWITVVIILFQVHVSEACTGITLTTKDNSMILARTIEWGGSDLNSQYVVVPRGYEQYSYIPGGERSGMKFTARYGYIGLSVEQKEFVAEGLNEAGLSAGLFYFPGYGRYEDYDSKLKDSSIADLQLVSWILGNFSTVDEAMKAIKKIHIVPIDPRASTVHWRMADITGKQIVLEIVDGQPNFYENTLGVLTNSPGFDWHMTNLNNYINLYPGTTNPRTLGNIKLSSFGAGSGFLGIPGDVTTPSRFIRAAFYQTSSPQKETAIEAVIQSFHILNNFDIPIGIEFSESETPTDIPSATQWTSSTDLTHRVIYYRTMYNSDIRCIDLKAIDFNRVKYQAVPLDLIKQQPIQPVRIN